MDIMQTLGELIEAECDRRTKEAAILAEYKWLKRIKKLGGRRLLRQVILTDMLVEPLPARPQQRGRANR